MKSFPNFEAAPIDRILPQFNLDVFVIQIVFPLIKSEYGCFLHSECNLFLSNSEFQYFFTDVMCCFIMVIIIIYYDSNNLF